MDSLLKIAFVIALVCTITNISAQEYLANIQHYNRDEGLSHREVNCTFQDSRGFIWVGTQYGLNRFDGKAFKIFTKEKHGMASNEIHHILEDADGWLWLFTNQGWHNKQNFSLVSCLNIYTYEVLGLEERFNNSIKSDQIFTAISNKDKTIFLGTKEGELIRYHPETGITTTKVISAKSLGLSYCSHEKTLIGIGLGKNDIDYLELDTLGKLLYMAPDPINMQHIGQSRNGIHWHWNCDNPTPSKMQFYSNLSLKEVLPIDFSKTTFPGGDQIDQVYYTSVVLNGKDDFFWMKAPDRFFVFHPEEELIYDFNKEFPQICQNQIHDIYFDDRNYAWVGTANGLYKIQLRESPFRKYLSLPLETYSIEKAFSARGILEYNGELFVSSVVEDQYRIDLKSNGSSVFPYLESVHQEKGEIINTHTILPILLTDHERILFGGNLIFKYEPWNESVVPLYYKEVKQFFPIIWSLFEDNNNRVWAGTHNKGLSYWDKASNDIKLFKHYNEFDELLRSPIYTFLAYDDKHLLVGSASGIYILHQDKGIIQRFWTGGDSNNILPDDLIYHLQRDKEKPQCIWVATGGGGLIQIELENVTSIDTLEQYTIADGLSTNVVYAVYEDEQENLWMPSDYGIIRLNKTTRNCKAYLTRDGVTHNEFNRISHFQSDDGTLYFGGLNGVTAFHPKDVIDHQESFDAPLQIISYQQYDGKSDQLIDRTIELMDKKAITLGVKDHFFQIHFALLEYQDPTQIRYAYQIVGQNEGWTMIKDNSLRISGLPYGNYTLKIKGQGVSGQFSIQELNIPILVLKPFYLKAWFYLTVLFSILGGTFIFYKMRTRQLKRQRDILEEKVLQRTAIIASQKEKLESLDEIKTRFFANVSHELRTPLTLMLGPISSALKSNTLSNRNFTFLKLANQNGQELLRLVNEILDLTKMESDKLKLNEKKTAFYPFLRRLIASFESHAERLNISFEFEYQADPYLQLKLDQNKFEKILNNLLSNALKFTPSKGEVLVLLKDRAKSILLEVRDTGRGIHPDDLPHVFDRFYQSEQPNVPTEGGMGIGLALSQEFSKLMNGKLWVESTLGEGSTFFFELPKREVLGTVDLSTDLVSNAQKLVLRESQNEELHSPFAVQATPETDLDKPRILVVEDNYSLRDYIKMVLSEQYEVCTAENGKIGWESLLNKFESRQCPDLIISDIMMPEMDGYQLLERFKSDGRFRHLPVIMLTARAELQDKLKALRIGVDDYMLKPFEEEELIARVKNLLINSKARNLGVDMPVATSEKAQTITEADQKWLEELEEVTKKELSQFHFNVEYLASEMAYSRRQLNRRIKQLTGLTASEYIQEVRFNQARTMLENRVLDSVKAVALEVGLKDVKHFSTLFKKRFGKLPSFYF